MNPPDEPRSLLRRLLKKAEHGEAQPTEQPKPPAMSESAIMKMKRSTAPIRPVSPLPDPEPVQPLMPAPRATQVIPPYAAPLTTQEVAPVPTDDPTKAEEALLRVREKTAQIAVEFADGRLNRAQFAAMYARYNEVRTVIERLISNNPNSKAWKNVARPGVTTFLRQHFQAQTLSYAVYAYDRAEPMLTQGTPEIPLETLGQILRALKVYIPAKGVPGPAGKGLDSGKWVTIVPGQLTVTLVLYSLEPSATQVTLIQDMQRDFERANRLSLERGIRQPDQLVFPHRALITK
ncbi:MAG: hypothetical protein KF716_08590 [Anaerolineae bacterium]|nr:hypothetical protein [Anaerolineae bacterium]